MKGGKSPILFQTILSLVFVKYFSMCFLCSLYELLVLLPSHTHAETKAHRHITHISLIFGQIFEIITLVQANDCNVLLISFYRLLFVIPRTEINYFVCFSLFSFENQQKYSKKVAMGGVRRANTVADVQA